MQLGLENLQLCSYQSYLQDTSDVIFINKRLFRDKLILFTEAPASKIHPGDESDGVLRETGED